MNVNCSDEVKIDHVAGRRGHRTGAPVYKDSCPFRPLVCRWLSSVSTGTQAPPRSSGSLPPGPLHRAWEQVGAWSLFMADWATQAHWPPGSLGEAGHHHIPRSQVQPSAKVYARLPTSGAPDVSPVSLPPSPLQCLFFAICPHLDLLIPGDWGLPKGTNSDSGLLGAQGSAWQTSGAQKPSINLLVSRKLGLSAKNLVKSSKPHALLQSRENWGPVVEPSCMKTIGESPAPVIENRVRFCIPPTSRSGPCSCLEGPLDRYLVCSLRWSPTSAPLVLGVADPHAPVVSGWVHGLDLTHHPIR